MDLEYPFIRYTRKGQDPALVKVEREDEMAFHKYIERQFMGITPTMQAERQKKEIKRK